MNFFVNEKGKVVKLGSDKICFRFQTKPEGGKLTITQYTDGEKRTMVFAGKVKGKTPEWAVENFDKSVVTTKVEKKLMPAIAWVIGQLEANQDKAPKIGETFKANIENTPTKVGGTFKLVPDKETLRFKRFSVSKNEAGVTGTLYLPKGCPDELTITIA